MTSRLDRWLSAAAPGVRASVFAAWAVAAGFVGTAIADPVPGIFAGTWVVLAGAAATAAASVGIGLSPMRELAESADQVVYPYHLDGSCLQILAGAQGAIEYVLHSEVRAAGLLEVDEPTLRRHEWEIASALRSITGLRLVHIRQQPAGMLTETVVASQQRALAVAQEATAGRAAALQRFAAQVGAADAAHRDWREAQALSGLNDRYLDLVAATAADELAVAEIGDLTQRAAITAAALQEVLQDNLRAASHSAELLAV
ncbi:MAG TPA: hypothetical protein VGI58_09615 [Streptosporangiaceae bacterium]|jgi:hypothetical protein